MTDYSSITILIVILMLTMIVHVLTYSGFNKRQKAWFVATFAAISICSAAEFAVHCGYYDPIFKIPLTIITVIQFSISPVMAMLFSGALGLKYQGRIAGSFFALSFLAEVICAPFGWIFYFNDVGYSRGPAFTIYEVFYFVSLAYLIVALIIVGRKFRHRDRTTIIMILVVLVAGIVPMTFFQVHVAYSAIGISSCLCYILYNDLVQQDTQAELLSKQEKINEMQEHIISGLASLIESRDTETGEHVSRTSAIVKMLAEDCLKEGLYTDQINDHFITLLYTLAPMHDVGKIIVSDKILRKPGRLEPEEFEEMKKHAAEGGNVVRKILSGITEEEYLKFASDIATYHHERWDGTGYPLRLEGENIPLAARIMAIADVFDALISKRCYKGPYSFEDSMRMIEEEAGSHFDPNLVEVFVKYKDRYSAFCKVDELKEGKE